MKVEEIEGEFQRVFKNAETDFITKCILVFMYQRAAANGFLIKFKHQEAYPELVDLETFERRGLPFSKLAIENSTQQLVTAKLTEIYGKLNNKPAPSQNQIGESAFLGFLRGKVLRKANAQKVKKKKNKAKTHKLTQTPSRVISDIIWNLSNSKYRPEATDHVQDAFTEKGKIVSFEALLKVSKNKFAKSVGTNIEAIDFLLQTTGKGKTRLDDISSLFTDRNEGNFEGQTGTKKTPKNIDADYKSELESNLRFLLNTPQTHILRECTNLQNITSVHCTTQNRFSEILAGAFPDVPGTKGDYNYFIDQVILRLKRLRQDIDGVETRITNRCQIEAVADLVFGNLHRLDPVNGDASCQFRVPFIYDLYHAVICHFDVERIAQAKSDYYTYLNRMGIAEIHQRMHALGKEEDTIATALRNLPANQEESGQENLEKFGLHLLAILKDYRNKGDGRNLPKKLTADTLEQQLLNYPTFHFEHQVSKIIEKKSKDKLVWEIPRTVVNKDVEIIRLEETGHFHSLYLEAVQIIAQLQLQDMTTFGTDTPVSLNSCLQKWDKTPASYMNGQFQRVYPDECNTSRFLTLCKMLSVKQRSIYDNFYLLTFQKTMELPGLVETDMNDLYVEMAWYSTVYIKQIFSELAKHPSVIGNRTVQELVSGLQKTEWYYNPKTAAGNVIAYYENKRLLYIYMFLKKMPIIVDLRRIIATPQGEDEYSYRYSGGGIYYFAPDPETQRYIRIPNEALNDGQKHQFGLALDCYSMMVKDEESRNPELPNFAYAEDYAEFEKGWLEETDLMDQILITTMSHGAATGSTQRRCRDRNYETDVPDTKTGFCKLHPLSRTPNRLQGSFAEDDTIWLYLNSYNADLEFPDLEALVSQAQKDTQSLNVDFKARKPGSGHLLPLFADTYNGVAWDTLKERALIDKISEPVGYKGYLYQREVEKNATEQSRHQRSAVTYILTCKHLYVSSYAIRDSQFAHYCENIGHPDTQDGYHSIYTINEEGHWALDFMDGISKYTDVNHNTPSDSDDDEDV